jgi:hypothetical protein
MYMNLHEWIYMNLFNFISTDLIYFEFARIISNLFENITSWYAHKSWVPTKFQVWNIFLSKSIINASKRFHVR